MDDPQVAELYVPFEDLEDWDYPVRSRTPTRPMRIVAAPAVDPPPAISRTHTEEIEMRVMLDDGLWHREMTYDETSCGQEIRTPLRRETSRPKEYDGAFCQRDCWSHRELLRVAAMCSLVNEERDLAIQQERPALTSLLERDQKRAERLAKRMTELRDLNVVELQAKKGNDDR